VKGNGGQVKKILKHLGLWEVKPRPVCMPRTGRPLPRATGPQKTPKYSMDYSVSQLPLSDKLAICGPGVSRGLPASGGPPRLIFKIGLRLGEPTPRNEGLPYNLSSHLQSGDTSIKGTVSSPFFKKQNCKFFFYYLLIFQ